MWFTDDFCVSSDWPTDQKQRAEVSSWLFFFFPLTTYCFFLRAHFQKMNKADESPEFFFSPQGAQIQFKQKENKKILDGGSFEWMTESPGNCCLNTLWEAPHTGCDGQRLGVCFGVFFSTAVVKDIFKNAMYHLCLNCCTPELSGLATIYFPITRWQLLYLGIMFVQKEGLYYHIIFSV